MSAPVPAAASPMTTVRWLIFAWGVLGVCLVLLNPILRLSALPIETVAAGLTPVQWVVAVVWVAFMMYSEAWRGFHKQFAPRVAVRALAVARNPLPHTVVLAPFVCMGLLHATKRRKIVAWSLLTGIVVLVVLVRQLPSPWRAIVDMGVVLGLASGLLSVLWFGLQTVRGTPPDVPDDMPTD